MSDKADLDTGQPIKELRDHTVEPNPELGGRVRRSINRRSLVADSLDFSINIMLKTVWEYVQTLIESLPGSKSHDKEE
ncbi:MAG: hypothetical protein KAH56_12915 [Candidatus Krumholzibacteria bacterium]|nr:hypothetical protein [Candidatus Krumholzibacteria bacterium]